MCEITLRERWPEERKALPMVLTWRLESYWRTEAEAYKERIERLEAAIDDASSNVSQCVLCHDEMWNQSNGHDDDCPMKGVVIPEEASDAYS